METPEETVKKLAKLPLDERAAALAEVVDRLENSLEATAAVDASPPSTGGRAEP